ncbi:MAG: hypothetical protein J5958_06540 [Clostridia bacterium]|nr:hypothetical protein [Clostridia bacterium]
MFKLSKILGGRINVPEIRKIPVTFGSQTVLAAGDAVVAMVTEGAASSYTQTASYAKLGHQTEGIIQSIYIVAKGITVAASTETEIEVYDVSPEMVFEVPVAATIASSKVGVEYVLNSSGKLTTTLAGVGANQSHRYRGVILFDRNGATAEDKLALVTFPRNLA